MCWCLNFSFHSIQLQELKIRPCPIIFASFSGGPKACMYKVIQVNAILSGLVNLYLYIAYFKVLNVSKKLRSLLVKLYEILIFFHLVADN